MTKLESYMIEGSFSATQFYADVEGHPDDRGLVFALEELSFFSKELTVLGEEAMKQNLQTMFALGIVVEPGEQPARTSSVRAAGAPVRAPDRPLVAPVSRKRDAVDRSDGRADAPAAGLRFVGRRHRGHCLCAA